MGGRIVWPFVVNEGDVEITYHPERIMNTKNRLIKAVLCEGVWLPEQGLLRTRRTVFELPSRFVARAA